MAAVISTRSERPAGDGLSVETGRQVRPVQVFAVLGETLVERGVSSLAARPWQKTALRFLSITAASHLAIGLTYNLPQAFVGARSSTWPTDIQRRSYLTNHICGPDTGRVCPGPGVPLPRP